MNAAAHSRLPALLSRSFEFREGPFLGVSLDGRLLNYYSLFIVVVRRMLVLLRIVNSPFGRVLQAIRGRELRLKRSAIAWWFTAPRRTSWWRCLPRSPVRCSRSGCVTSGRPRPLSFEIMLDALLIVVTGSMGTIYGAALFVIAQSHLQDLPEVGSDAAAGTLAWLSVLLSPDC